MTSAASTPGAFGVSMGAAGAWYTGRRVIAGSWSVAQGRSPADTLTARPAAWPAVIVPSSPLTFARQDGRPLMADCVLGAVIGAAAAPIAPFTLGQGDWIAVDPAAFLVKREAPDDAPIQVPAYPMSVHVGPRAYIELRLATARGGAALLKCEDPECHLMDRATALAQRAPTIDDSSAAAARRAAVVDQVRRILWSRLREGISLADISSQVGMSAFHLCRVFRKGAGSPIHRYLLIMRLRGTVDALVQTDEKLAAIADAFGFVSESHLSDAFLREFGCRPSAVRQAGRRGQLVVDAAAPSHAY